jgi:ABC-2 type transport system ATP-binding protein
VLDGRVRDLRRAHRGERYSVEFDSRSAAVDRFMETTALLRSRVRSGPRWEIEPLPGVDARRLLSEVSALDVPLLRFEHVEPSLHEIFVRQVGEAAASEAG